MGDRTFELPANTVQNSTYVDMSGWVNVELPEEEGNRIGSKGLERIDELASSAQGENPAVGHPGANVDVTDHILAVAVRESDSAASAELLRTALKVKQDAALTGELKELDLSRQAACNALKDLDSLTGEDLASFAEMSEDDWNKTFAGDLSAMKSGQNDEDDKVKAERMAKAELARAHLNDAVKAQKNYAKELVDYCGKKGWPVGHPQREALLQLANRSLSRATKIEELWKQLRDAKSAVGDSKFDQALLNRRGFADRIYFEEAKNVDILGGQKNPRMDAEELHRRGATKAMMVELHKITSAYGDGLIRQKDVQTVAAHNFIDGFKLSEKLVEDLDGCSLLLAGEEWKTKYDEIVTGTRVQLPANLDIGSEALIQAAETLPAKFTAYKESMRRYADALLSARGKDDASVASAGKELKKRRDELVKSCETLRGASSVINAESGNDYRLPKLKNAFGEFRVRLPRVDLEEENLMRICTFKGREKDVGATREDLIGLIEGSRRISPLVEAKVWGEGGSHDTELEGLELVDVKELGHGSFNAVKLCTFVKKDGTTVQRVFRTDSGARVSVAVGAISAFYSKCPEDVSGFSYSQASGEVASIFGCTDVLPKTTFGTLNGQPGMFMEVAPGKDGGFFHSHVNDRTDKDPFKAKSSHLSKEDAGNVARKLNRLQWLDFLTGQIDRHPGNLMIGLNDDESVSVKGIDNDECFPEISIGDGLLVVNGQEDLIDNPKLSFVMDGMSAEAMLNGGERERLDPTLETLLADKFVVDVSKRDLKTRVKFLAMHHNYGLPNRIDEELAGKLKDMNVGEYGEKLRKNTKLNEAQILAAQARLALAKKKIAELEQQQKVHKVEDWKNGEILQEISASGSNVPIGVEIKNYNTSLAAKKRANAPGSEIEQEIDENTKTHAAHVQADYYARVKFHKFAGFQEEQSVEVPV